MRHVAWAGELLVGSVAMPKDAARRRSSQYLPLGGHLRDESEPLREEAAEAA